MRLVWAQKKFRDDVDFILFHQKNKTPLWWHRQLFRAYPDLDYDYCWMKNITEKQRFIYINKQMKLFVKQHKSQIKESVDMFESAWKPVSEKLNIAYSSAFDNDCSKILNKMKAEIGLNPICPRDVHHHSFSVYYRFDTKTAMATALHEITHFVWFYFWKKHFKDKPSEYDCPKLKWLLSEIVVETIIRNSDIGKLTKQPKYIAYSYFYNMKIGRKPVFDIMKKLYINRKDIYDFMEKSFDWIQKNEPELRKKIEDAEK